MGSIKFIFTLCILVVVFSSHVSEARKRCHHSHRLHHRCGHKIKVPPHVSISSNPNLDFLDEHNKARAEVGVGPMKWNDTLATYAQDYANKKIETCEMVHSEGPYGECLAEGYGYMTGLQATKLWVSEKENYDYASNACIKDQCGHYTQIVWKDTTDIGCAKAHCKNGWVFIICSYFPPGNYVGEKPY